MAVSFLGHEVSDLCIGKPALRSLPPSATVADALVALRASGEPQIFVLAAEAPDRKAVPWKIGVADVVSYLCSDDNIQSPASALRRPVTALRTKEAAGLVHLVEPHCSVLRALDVILEGAQILVVPIRSSGRKKLHHQASAELCWLTQEDFVRYFLNCIAIFSPIPSLSIEELGLIRPADVLAVRHDDPAILALPLIRRALAEQTAVAVVTDDGKLFGEISPRALAASDETVAAAIATLTAGDLMAYMDYCGAPPEVLVRAIKSRLEEKNLKGMLELMEDEFTSSYSSSSSSISSSSSDEESGSSGRRLRRARTRSFSIGRSGEPVVTHPASSLVAAMAQAIACRVSYLWVVEEEEEEEEERLVGIVMFVDLLRIFREQMQPQF